MGGYGQGAAGRTGGKGAVVVNILIVANHWAVASGRYTKWALKRRGHVVCSAGPEKGRDIWGLTLPEWAVWTPEPGPEGWQADLVMVMDSDPAVLDAVGVYAAKSAPWVVWGVDNHVRDYRRENLDHYFLAHKSVSVQAYDEQTTHLPCGYDPTIFKVSGIPWEQREWDVAMIGVMYPRRWALVKALQKAGLKVLAGTGLVYDNMAAAYQNARVSLCVSAAGDVAQRVFETAACGCAIVTDKLGDLDEKAAGALVYETDEAAVELCRQAQREPERGVQAAAWAKPQTWDERARVIEEWYTKHVAKTLP